MHTEGYVKLYRSILDWEWFKNKNTRLVFEFLLYTANYKDKQWKGKTIKRGQVFTSYAKLAGYNDISIQQARTAVSNMKSTGDITVLSTGGGLLINVCNYSKYQDPEPVSNTEDNSLSNSESTGDQQANEQANNNNIRNKEFKNNIHDDDNNAQGARARGSTNWRNAPESTEMLYWNHYCVEKTNREYVFHDETFPAFKDLFRFYSEADIRRAVVLAIRNGIRDDPVGYIREACEALQGKALEAATGG